MENLIITGIILILVVGAMFYIWKQKKKGLRCIGCPACGCCSAKKSENVTESCKCHSGSN